MNSFVVLSDIHANLSALQAVIEDFQKRYRPDGLILLGDLVNYGMRPNEVIKEIEKLSREYPIVCNIYGNHEAALFYPQEHFARFSSDRGRQILTYTREKLSPESWNYLDHVMEKSGRRSFEISGKKVLCIHGELNDPFWGKLATGNTGDERYAVYDYVFSGHTHLPHHMEILYKTEAPEQRNRKKTVFLNPGSVGQPRNHNPMAQYLYADLQSETFHHNCVEYDITKEQSLYTDETDEFYRDRLIKGI